ncbi:MAG: GxxExxY protein [Bacteroidota bacterium]
MERIGEGKQLEEINQITEGIIGAAIEVHKALGPGPLESAYSTCLAYELKQRGFDVLQEVPLPLVYKGAQLDCGYRLDLLVNETVIVEIKSVEELAAIHEAQLLSYLKLAGCKIGLLINFNVKMLKYGIRRMAN